MQIEYSDRQEEMVIDIMDMDLMEKSIATVLDEEGIEEDVMISVSFVGDEEMRELNTRYRGVHDTTDVLSFPMEDEFCMDGQMLGDIVINVKKVIEQATEYGHSKERELSYLTVHSTLHLLGYDHIEAKDRMKMRAREKEIMSILQIHKEVGDETR